MRDLFYGDQKFLEAFQTKYLCSSTNLHSPRICKVFFFVSNSIFFLQKISFCSKTLLGQAEEGSHSGHFTGRLSVPQVIQEGGVGNGAPCSSKKRWHSAAGAKFTWFSLYFLLTGVQGDELTSTHKVQSFRAVVEQTIADLKTAKVLSGNKVSSIVEREKELDCVIALHNLRVLLKQDANYTIVARRAALPGEHIFRPVIPAKEVDLKIPPPIVPKDEPNYVHIRKFAEFLSSAIPSVKKALEIGGKSAAFFPTVGKRGKNLYEGAYVLQLRVQYEGLDVWTVKYLVGASYSYEVHTGYFQMSCNNPVLHHICDCYGG